MRKVGRPTGPTDRDKCMVDLVNALQAEGVNGGDDFLVIGTQGKTCTICGAEITADQPHHREVVGYKPHRTGGGQNHVILPEETGRRCHSWCAEAAKTGLVGQEALA